VKLLLFVRDALPAPPHFREAGDDLVDAWDAVADPRRAAGIEVAALLLHDFRANGIGWPPERVRLLADILKELRS
jgi:hypothetical protein